MHPKLLTTLTLLALSLLTSASPSPLPNTSTHLDLPILNAPSSSLTRRTIIKCGCTNTCKLTCKIPGTCICSSVCDPNYLCKSKPKPSTPRRPIKPYYENTAKRNVDVDVDVDVEAASPEYNAADIVEGEVKAPAVIIERGRAPMKCGCTNDCVRNCKIPGTCICKAVCDPRYECKKWVKKPRV